MQSIEIMVEEHENISRMLEVIRELNYQFMIEADYDLEDFNKVLDFIKNYADGHHHKKEEDILFKNMEIASEELKNSGALIGMYIEHDTGRLYRSNLVSALEEFKSGNEKAKLDIIANCISYTDLLKRHIYKENTALYKLAERILDEDTKKSIDEETILLEEESKKSGFQDKYLNMIVELEEKYLEE